MQWTTNKVGKDLEPKIIQDILTWPRFAWVFFL